MKSPRKCHQHNALHYPASQILLVTIAWTWWMWWICITLILATPSMVKAEGCESTKGGSNAATPESSSADPFPPKTIDYQNMLSELERSWFKDSYLQETAKSRLRRLEEFCFGEEKSGTVAERMAGIYAISHVSIKQNASSTQGRTAANASPGRAPWVTTNSIPDSSSIAEVTNATEITKYPRVSKLEEVLLGQIYEHQPIQERLSRLEKRTFGAPSLVDDLSERTDALFTFARLDGGPVPVNDTEKLLPMFDGWRTPDPTMHTDKLAGVNTGAGWTWSDSTPPPRSVVPLTDGPDHLAPSNTPTTYLPSISELIEMSANSSDPEKGLIARVRALEMNIFGFVKSGNLPDRITELEASILGKPPLPVTDIGLPERVQKLSLIIDGKDSHHSSRDELPAKDSTNSAAFATNASSNTVNGKRTGSLTATRAGDQNNNNQSTTNATSRHGLFYRLGKILVALENFLEGPDPYGYGYPYFPGAGYFPCTSGYGYSSGSSPSIASSKQRPSYVYQNNLQDNLQNASLNKINPYDPHAASAGSISSRPQMSATAN